MNSYPSPENFTGAPRPTKTLGVRYEAVRQASERIAAPLGPEDCCIQSMPDVSPTKWHLAHTSWFFETFVLKAGLPDYRSPDPHFDFLFNSYYNSVGDQYSRPARGLLSRPTLAEVMAYRSHVDEALLEFLQAGPPTTPDLDFQEIIELGLQHEQQHQELMLMDIKHVLYQNPLRPAYREDLSSRTGEASCALTWSMFDAGLYRIGHEGPGFHFDNEGPRHRGFVESVQVANRLTTCGEYLEFIEDSGYSRPELWLSDGWATVQEKGWEAPLYWETEGDRWRVMTLGGMRDLNLAEPVCHLSYYEADAYARWREAWLPREYAWEVIAENLPTEGNFRENDLLHPVPTPGPTEQPQQMFGDVWEWTASPYTAYPGYRARNGALGEYNGKFMSNQMVLRGGSCVTPSSHIRTTYRNFFPPDARWPFTGIRLTREA